MTKQDLILRVYESNDVETKAAAERILDLIVDTIRGEVIAGNSVSIRGFGTFSNVAKAARAERQGHNPQTNEKITIPAQPASRKVKFSVSSAFKSLVAK